MPIQGFAILFSVSVCGFSQYQKYLALINKYVYGKNKTRMSWFESKTANS